MAALLIATAGAACGEDLEAEQERAAEVLVGPAADYVVAAVGDPPASMVLGQSFSLLTTVQNVGDAAATVSSTTAYRLSTDPVAGGDVKFARRVEVPALAIGASDTQQAALVVPAGVPDGTYYVLACADSTSKVVESDNSNNCAATGPVALTGADLVVDAVTEPPSSLAAGMTFSITDTVRNAGTAGVSSSLVGYFLSPTSTRGPASQRLGKRRQTGAIGPGGTSTGAITVTVPDLPAGSYHLIACADATSVVAETSEANNCTASAGTAGIGPPDLTVSSLTDPPATVLVGDSFTIDETTVNQGHLAAASTTTRFFLSQDSLPGGGLPVAARSVPPLPIGASSAGTTRITVDLTTPGGDYFVLACADATGAVAEALEDNNCRASSARVTVRALDTTCGADTGGMVIDAVVTGDGFTELRQGSSAQLVIAGTGLDAVTAVRLDEVDAALESVSATEVRASIVIPHGISPGPRALTVRDGTGAACSMAGAVTLTPFVISPAGSADGRGTFQSPLTLCAPALAGDAGAGDSVLLLAGQHECASVHLDGVRVAGQGAQATTVRGSFTLGSSVAYAASLRDMTVVAPSLALDLHLDGGASAAIANVTAPAGGIATATSSGQGAVAVDHYVYTGPGTGLRVTDRTTVGVTASQFSDCAIGILAGTYGTSPGTIARVNIFDSSITSCATGLLSEDGFVAATRVTMSDCDVGIDQSFAPGTRDEWPFSFLQLLDTHLVDNTIGVRVQAGSIEATDAVISGDDATPRPSDWGVYLVEGKWEMRGGAITGQTRAGIEVVAEPSTPFALLGVYGALIEGGERGIYAHGLAASCFLEMRSSVVRRQTAAAISWGLPCIVDVSGGNRLSVLGGFAFEDLRTQFSPPLTMEAAGLSLNGRTYSGLVQGPVSVPPDYRILSPEGSIQF